MSAILSLPGLGCAPGEAASGGRFSHRASCPKRGGGGPEATVGPGTASRPATPAASQAGATADGAREGIKSSWVASPGPWQLFDPGACLETPRPGQDVGFTAG